MLVQLGHWQLIIDAVPVACASTMRAAMVFQRWRIWESPAWLARPARTMSCIHSDSSCRPASTLSQRLSSRLACCLAATSGSGGGSAAAAAALASFFSAFSWRLSSQVCTQAGGSPPSVTWPPARISISASPCLQGNLRLGQEHLKEGPDRSTWVW